MELPLHLLSENFVKTKKITKDTPYEIQEMDARELLCPERLDLAAKIAYIEAHEKGGDMSFARELYRKHIEAFSEGNYTEPGDKNKTSLEKFFSVFDELIDNYKENGFDSDKSLVPIGRDNIILDGAHRTACAIFFGGKISVIRFPQFEVNFDYRYFRSRRLSEEMLEYMAIVYSRYASKPLYLACLWPVSTVAKRSQAIDIIAAQHGIVYDTSVMLKKNGLRNFMMQIYQHQDWIGTPDNHFAGVMGKADACFAPNTSTETILFEGGALEEVFQMKDHIRAVFMLDKHAVHISDSNEETKLMASLLFSANSRHALNYGKPDAFPQCFRKFMEIKGTGATLGTSATLAYYGIANVGEMVEDSVAFDEWNPRTYFVFDGLKLPALAQVKENLRVDDVEIPKEIAVLLKLDENNARKRKLEDFKTTFMWKAEKAELRCKQIAMKITQKIGLYEVLHRLYHR